MSCSKCENFCVESMPRAVYGLLNVFYFPCVLTNGEDLWSWEALMFLSKIKSIVNMREGAVSHVHFLCLDCLSLSNRQLKSWMQAPVSSLQVDLPSWVYVCCGSNRIGLVGFISKVTALSCICLVPEHLAGNTRVPQEFRSYPFLA